MKPSMAFGNSLIAPIIVPNVNLSLFNDSYLDVTAITGPYNDQNNDLFTWSATSID